MKLMIIVGDLRLKLDVKDVYKEILKYFSFAASRGERHIAICFLDDFVKFSHIKPIVDRLSKLSGLSISAEGSALMRPHLYIDY